MTDTITLDEFHKLPRSSKYRNKHTVVDGVRFHSKAEARRYLELKQLAAGGAITNLTLQPRYLIHDAGKARSWAWGNRYYVADFAYDDERGAVVEDVKGKRTQVYLLKRDLFLARYGDGVTFVEVEA